MTRIASTTRGLAVLAAVALIATGCGGGGDGGNGDGDGDTGAGAAVDGGTLTFLTLQEQFDHLDPQRNYAGEDLAFASGFMQRTLNSYAYSADGEEATQLVPDLATDTGTPNEDATSWSWTLKDGLKWEDGSDLTCEDIKYGVSRTFATDIITDGPTYAISMLDIPTDDEGASVYKGPYVTEDNDTAAFDEAVVCEGNKITFNLNKPVGDFNYTVTLLSFSPVPKAADTGEKYDDKPMSSGPYKIQEYSKGTRLVLVRNENWSKETDDYRPAHPDRIVVEFGLEATVIDQRMIADAGADKAALTAGDAVQPQSLTTIFGSDRFADRRTNELDPFVQYIAVNTSKVPNLEHRRAIAAALDRAQLRTIAGGEFAGPLADGVVKPNLPTDYEESEMWTGLLGQEIPDGGDPEYARQLIEQSGEELPELVYDYPQTPTNDRGAAAIVSALGKAGIDVRPNPLEAGAYYGIVLDPARQGHLTSAGSRAGGDARVRQVERLDGHPRAVHADRRLQPLAVRRQGVQRQGRAGQGRDRPRRPVDVVEGTQPGGHEQRLGDPDAVQPGPAAGRLRGGRGLRGGRQRLPVGAVRFVALRRAVRAELEGTHRSGRRRWPAARTGEGWVSPAPSGSPGAGREGPTTGPGWAGREVDHSGPQVVEALRELVVDVDAPAAEHPVHPPAGGGTGLQHLVGLRSGAQQVRAAVAGVRETLDQACGDELVDAVAQGGRGDAHLRLEVGRRHRLEAVQHQQRPALEGCDAVLLELLVEELAHPGVRDGDLQREGQGSTPRHAPDVTAG